ncbi:unnamed protein product [Parnassius apollo]|uniref:(apollo) hypothetical protein n=1 Tax=Parnassius apollo TaxID=110799 RepID=A0A8S3XCZ4_PARAO|nr:unnamed protein product [Parnassius apollo]
MACKTSFEFHHNFPKLAEESGFTFNIHKPRVHLEWNKIRLIDIESLIRDRKFILIEQHLNDILDCVLESQFDVRILDEGVLKIFRLAQLAVEYQQFCRHYLDRSVYVLREEITALAQELDYTKKTIREKEDEIRKLKRKNKYNFRGSLPYGNDNIANIILQTLSRKSDIFSTTPQLDNVHYNKCTYCDKVFLNQLYLKSHMLRRHNNVTEIPEKDVEQNQAHTTDNDHSKLQSEVIELKSKLKEMEVFIKNVNIQSNTKLNSEVDKNGVINSVEGNKAEITKNKTDEGPVKQMKDAEISTNVEENILDKMEEWKKEECKRYNNEISMLRTQISNLIDSYKDGDRFKTIPTDNKIIEQLNDTIEKQSAEIVGLKETINNLGLKSKLEDVDTKKEIEAQIAFWTERAEVQSREYKLLLQKLDIVAKEAHESRKCAELERQRATKLQLLLEQNINNREKTNNQILNGETNFTLVKENSIDSNCNTSPKKSNPVPDHKTLEKLHRRAQELLNTESTTSSDVSSTDGNNTNIAIEKQKTQNEKNIKGLKNNMSNRNGKKSDLDNIPNHKNLQKNIFKVNPNTARQVFKKHKSASKISNNSLNNNCSPKKVVRAKLTEEVNQRLASLRVDPLKKTLPQSIFQKHRLELQKIQEIKTKKNPARENVYHSIIAYLDNEVLTTKKKSLQEDAYVSPSRNTKSFSLTSMISNVKSKALSLIKTSEEFNNEESASHETVTKKSQTLVTSPTGSTASSPKTESQNRSYQTRGPKELNIINPKNNKQKPKKIRNGYVKKMKKISESSKGSDTDTNENFHFHNKEILAAKTVEDFIKSPNRLHNPSSVGYNATVQKKLESDESVQTKHLTNTFKELDTNAKHSFNTDLENEEKSSEDMASLIEHELRNVASDENMNNHKQMKGVLKNASSMSSLYKKKVIFDMDAIQMKSVSASPSQSVTEKNDKDEKYELGIINLDTEEWDLSSIENEPIRAESTVIKRSSTSPKIAELKQSIESQLTRRNPTLSTTLVGGVDVMKAASLGGSNTSLGSSILDDSESDLKQNHTAFVKRKNVTEKDDSEIDISQFVIDSINNKNKYKSF